MILDLFSVILQNYSEKVCDEVAKVDFSYISSKENKLVKAIRKLMSSARERNQTNLFVLEGLRLCMDAALNNYKIEKLVVSESFAESDKIELIKNSANELYKVPDSLFSYLSDTVSPQGVLCVVRKPDTLFNTNEIVSGRYIALENTADPANLGTIARTAEALGLKGLIISSNGCDPFSPKAQRAGMGALLRLPIIISNSFIDDMLLIKSKGFKVFASVVKNADCDVAKVNYPNDAVVMIGNEANGLSDEAVSVSDMKITITMSGRAESLNAAAAAAIIMWEITRNGGV